MHLLYHTIVGGMTIDGTYYISRGHLELHHIIYMCVCV